MEIDDLLPPEPSRQVRRATQREVERLMKIYDQHRKKMDHSDRARKRRERNRKQKGVK